MVIQVVVGAVWSSMVHGSLLAEHLHDRASIPDILYEVEDQVKDVTMGPTSKRRAQDHAAE